MSDACRKKVGELVVVSLFLTAALVFVVLKTTQASDFDLAHDLQPVSNNGVFRSIPQPRAFFGTVYTDGLICADASTVADLSSNKGADNCSGARTNLSGGTIQLEVAHSVPKEQHQFFCFLSYTGAKADGVLKIAAT
ncbi:MAG: hypothetical protein LBP35_03465 [Candidatus Ancillula trichonymphae]|jgi:hypothetical protein|nr:hypothetical protein [Candidatus Ancillula trichonymphae]